MKTATRIDSRRLVTIALIGSGAALAATGLTMLASAWGATGVAAGAAKAWKLIGVSDKAIGTIHQWSAVAFLAASGTHVVQRRRVVARHLGLGPRAAKAVRPTAALRPENA